ncbi:hypothetical protein ACFLVC_02875 [Chloroflexota bacterium]
MSTYRIRIIYIISLMILVILVIVVVFRPFGETGGYSEVQRAQLIQAGNKWIIQFDILNREAKRQDYTINVFVDDAEYTEYVSIGDGRIYSYIHHVRSDMVSGDSIDFVIYKEGNDKPIEQITYHLK